MTSLVLEKLFKRSKLELKSIFLSCSYFCRIIKLINSKKLKLSKMLNPFYWEVTWRVKTVLLYQGEKTNIALCKRFKVYKSILLYFHNAFCTLKQVWIICSWICKQVCMFYLLIIIVKRCRYYFLDTHKLTPAFVKCII